MENMNYLKEQILSKFAEFNLKISDEQAEKFGLYYNFLVQENEKYNLTAITELSDVILKHFIDSVLGASYIPLNAYVCDIGTGAGFPAMPLKIFRPDLKVVMVDSLNKRVNFLNSTISLLNLDGITAIHSRAEDFLNNKEYREMFDIVVSRAVAGLPTLLEITTPALKVGGVAIYYKSSNIEEEMQLSKNAIKMLNCKFVEKYEIWLEDNYRNFCLFEKMDKTPANFPRGKNLPKNKPL